MQLIRLDDYPKVESCSKNMDPMGCVWGDGKEKSKSKVLS